ncbi:MAG TPA: MFS transporter [bacterium]|jgi:MFS family permease|nr:MFS transporter [bacterium]MDX9804355.1 MFS transporter [bacterium]HPY14667.1 MFS transporter [bacterium]HQM85338.1 MFS transporter [bacterium]HRQ70572.1 MFS transporter [bacterium]
MQLADFITYSIFAGMTIAFLAIIWSYAKGLRQSPRDMWLMFIYNIIEYTAYMAMNIAVTLWLTADCGVGDLAAGNYIMLWSILLSIIGMITGAVVDTIGIRKTLMISIIFLLISRFFMSFITDPYIIFVLGFIPMAIGFAIVGPLISVAIKRFTTKDTVAMGFGLFYVLMNLGYALGGLMFDGVRDVFSLRDSAGKIINENAGIDILGLHFSTYQMFFVIGFLFTIVSMIVAFFIRGNIELNDDGKLTEVAKKELGSGFKAVRNSAIDVWNMISKVVAEKMFWVYIGMLALTLFVRFVFFHFSYTFPKYGISILGEGAKIGNIYGVLNSFLIIFTVPVVAYLTKKTASYKMLIIGSIVSSLSCFIAVIPSRFFVSLTDTVLGEMIFVKWLGLADSAQALSVNPPTPEYWPLIFFILIFTIGEAIWSPRLMQFTAEIAPKGKEGTYIALSILPWFAAKFFVGPMSGLLVKIYTPFQDGHPLPPADNYTMVWVWIGGMALLTPVTLILFGKYFMKILVPEKVAGNTSEN